MNPEISKTPVPAPPEAESLELTRPACSSVTIDPNLYYPASFHFHAVDVLPNGKIDGEFGCQEIERIFAAFNLTLPPELIAHLREVVTGQTSLDATLLGIYGQSMPEMTVTQRFCAGNRKFELRESGIEFKPATDDPNIAADLELPPSIFLLQNPARKGCVDIGIQLNSSEISSEWARCDSVCSALLGTSLTDRLQGVSPDDLVFGDSFLDIQLLSKLTLRLLEEPKELSATTQPDSDVPSARDESILADNAPVARHSVLRWVPKSVQLADPSRAELLAIPKLIGSPELLALVRGAASRHAVHFIRTGEIPQELWELGTSLESEYELSFIQNYCGEDALFEEEEQEEHESSIETDLEESNQSPSAEVGASWFDEASNSEVIDVTDTLDNEEEDPEEVEEEEVSPDLLSRTVSFGSSSSALGRVTMELHSLYSVESGHCMLTADGRVADPSTADGAPDHDHFPYESPSVLLTWEEALDHALEPAAQEAIWSFVKKLAARIEETTSLDAVQQKMQQEVAISSADDREYLLSRLGIILTQAATYPEEN